MPSNGSYWDQQFSNHITDGDRVKRDQDKYPGLRPYYGSGPGNRDRWKGGYRKIDERGYSFNNNAPINKSQAAENGYGSQNNAVKTEAGTGTQEPRGGLKGGSSNSGAQYEGTGSGANRHASYWDREFSKVLTDGERLRRDFAKYPGIRHSYGSGSGTRSRWKGGYRKYEKRQSKNTQDADESKNKSAKKRAQDDETGYGSQSNDARKGTGTGAQGAQDDGTDSEGSERESRENYRNYRDWWDSTQRKFITDGERLRKDEERHVGIRHHYGKGTSAGARWKKGYRKYANRYNSEGNDGYDSQNDTDEDGVQDNRRGYGSGSNTAKDGLQGTKRDYGSGNAAKDGAQGKEYGYGSEGNAAKDGSQGKAYGSGSNAAKDGSQGKAYGSGGNAAKDGSQGKAYGYGSGGHAAKRGTENGREGLVVGPLGAQDGSKDKGKGSGAQDGGTNDGPQRKIKKPGIHYEESHWDGQFSTMTDTERLKREYSKFPGMRSFYGMLDFRWNDGKNRKYGRRPTAKKDSQSNDAKKDAQSNDAKKDAQSKDAKKSVGTGTDAAQDNTKKNGSQGTDSKNGSQNKGKGSQNDGKGANNKGKGAQNEALRNEAEMVGTSSSFTNTFKKNWDLCKEAKLSPCEKDYCKFKVTHLTSRLDRWLRYSLCKWVWGPSTDNTAATEGSSNNKGIKKGGQNSSIRNEAEMMGHVKDDFCKEPKTAPCDKEFCSYRVTHLTSRLDRFVRYTCCNWLTSIISSLGS